MVKLIDKICYNIEPLLEYLNIKKYNIYHNKVKMPCPIHGGDNPGACVIFLDGEYKRGNFMCFTHGCHQNGDSIFDLAFSLLDKPPEQIKKDIGLIYNNINTNNQIVKKNINDNKIVNKEILKRSEFLNGVIIPSNYYQRRGFSKEVLKRFDVGFCNDFSNNMYMRSVIPVYDDQRKSIIGVVGRSVFEECSLCGSFHSPKMSCPEGYKIGLYPKWKNSPGFRTSEALYNSWNLKDDSIYMVEGQSDVWRMIEAGYENTLGMLGCFLKDGQHKILKKLDVKKIIFLPDSDKAGKQGVDSFIKKYKNEYKWEIKNLPKKDISSMTIKEVKDFIK